MREDSKTFRILLVDDHPLFRRGLEDVVKQDQRLQIIHHAECAASGLEAFKDVEPDLVVTDLSFAESSGLTLIKRIRDLPSQCPVLVLSMHEESFWAEQVLQCGANGYLQKDADVRDVIDAIHKTAAGDIYLSNTMQQKLLRQISGLTENNTPLQVLSRRELEIFQYIAQGYDSSEIASNLFISLKTVHTHQSNIKQKLGQKNLKELRALARSYAKTSPPLPA